jgi:hypothetical protein
MLSVAFIAENASGRRLAPLIGARADSPNF